VEPDEYSPDELRAAFLADEASRIVQENSDLFAFSNSRRPSYGTAVPDPEATAADLTPDEVDAAVFELAAVRGMDPADVLDQVAALAGGKRDTASRAAALVELAAMDADVDAPLLELAVSAEAREKFAKSGVAMEGGDYPIADVKHLGVAKAYYKQGKFAGHSAEEVKAHINARAKALGLPGLDEDDEDEDEGSKAKVKVARRGQHVASRGSSEGVAPFPGAGEGGEGPSGAGPGGELAATVAKRLMVRTADGIKTIALTDGQAAEVLGMTGETLSPVDRIIRRHPELFLANDDARNYNLAVSAFEQAPEVLLKPPPFEVHEVPHVEDATDPDGGRTSAVVARLQREHPEYFSPSQAYGANVTHRR
jgi:hypothetical protein